MGILSAAHILNWLFNILCVHESGTVFNFNMRADLLGIVENAYSELAVLWQNWGVWVFNVSAGDGDATWALGVARSKRTDSWQRQPEVSGRKRWWLLAHHRAAGLSLAWSSQPLWPSCAFGDTSAQWHSQRALKEQCQLFSLEETCGQPAAKTHL